MSGANSFKFVLLPPQSDTTRDWAKRLAEIVPEARVIVAEDADTAAREIVDAEAAFGWLGSDLLSKATKLRWLQAPQAAPPAGSSDLPIIHPVSWRPVDLIAADERHSLSPTVYSRHSHCLGSPSGVEVRVSAPVLGTFILIVRSSKRPVDLLDQRFRSSNHIRPPCRAYRPRCERRAPD